VEISILEDRPNPLLKRHEYRFEVAHATAATPSRDAVRGELSKLVKAPKDRVIIERMHARYGTATTRGDAVVYETVDEAKLTVRAHILVRNGLREKEAKVAAPPAEPAAPVAPAKSEVPAEAKSEPKEEPKPVAEPKADAPKPASKPRAPKAAKADAAPAAE
jgi:ribosomal protein S24E